MKTILGTRFIEVPEGVTVTCKARTVTVTGPRGKLEREFKHIQIDITEVGDGKLRLDLWFGTRKQTATIRTIASHVENMITGVTRGFLYKMRMVYSHFPINVTVSGDKVEIRNFLGDKLVRRVKLQPGVKAVKSALDKYDYGSNSIVATSFCADEVNRVLEQDFSEVYDYNFNMGGLAGFPFGGITSFGAMADRKSVV